MADNVTPLILLTRPKAASDRFARLLRAELDQPVDIVIAPLMDIVPTQAAPDLRDVGGVIFTSEVAARQVTAPAGPDKVPAWCVGDRTARAAAEAGFAARSAGGTAADLIRMVRADAPTGRVLHLSGLHTRGNVAEELRKAGVAADSVAIYDQRPVPPPPAFHRAMAHGGHLIVPLFSPRSAVLFAQAAEGARRGDMDLIALSDAVRSALPAHMVPLCAATAAPTAAAMVVTLRRVVSRDASVDGPSGLV